MPFEETLTYKIKSFFFKKFILIENYHYQKFMSISIKH